MSTATKVKKLGCKYMVFINMVFDLLLLFACHLLTFIFEEKFTQKFIQIHIPNLPAWIVMYIFSESNV